MTIANVLTVVLLGALLWVILAFAFAGLGYVAAIMIDWRRDR